MAVAAVDRADQGVAVEQIRTALSVAVCAVNTFDEAKASLTELLLLVEDMMPNIARGVVQNYRRLNEAPIRAKAVLAKLEDPHA